MTGRGQPSLRVQAALDRLAWGVGDLKRVLLERGAWPAGANAAVAPDGGRWTVLGGRLRKRTGNRKAVSLLVPERGIDKQGSCGTPALLTEVRLTDFVQLSGDAPADYAHIAAVYAGATGFNAVRERLVIPDTNTDASGEVIGEAPEFLFEPTVAAAE